jgi:hypothetical protein
MDDLNKYLSELINRNLQFKRESGFTNYVLIAALFALIWKLIDTLDFLLSQENLELSVVIECSFVGLALAYCISIYREGRIAERKALAELRVTWKPEKLTSLTSLFGYPLLVLPIILYFFYALDNAREDSQSFFSLYYFALLLSFLIYAFRKYKVNMYKEFVSEEVIRFLELKSIHRARNSWTILLSGYILIVIILIGSGLFVYSTIYENNFRIVLYSIVCGFIVGIIIQIFIYLIAVEDFSRESKNLEGFQYDLLNNRINQSDVIDYLDEKVIGVPLETWVKKLCSQIDDLIDERENLLGKQDVDLEVLKRKIKKVEHKIYRRVYKLKSELKSVCNSDYLMLKDHDFVVINRLVLGLYET